MIRHRTHARYLFAPAAALLLAACGGSTTETTGEADATVMDGGGQMVTEQMPGAAGVPDTTMTPLPPAMTDMPPEADLPAEGPGTTPATQGTTPAI